MKPADLPPGTEEAAGQLRQDETAVLFRLFDRVFRVTGDDFRSYRQAMVLRRLEGRLRATGAGNYGEYLGFLETHPEEYGRLVNHLTITVSDFLRTPYTYQQMVRLVLPELVSRKRLQTNPDLQFWSAATARGQEAYSIALVLADFLGDRRSDFKISVNATDINRGSLLQARAGRYSLKDVAHLPAGLLERYFTRAGQECEVNADIKQMVTFRYHNLASSAPAPFINQDCIFCCNILIYLQRQAQEKVLHTLYHSLAVPGYLILGEAETPPGSLVGKLRAVDSRARIFQKTGRI